MNNRFFAINHYLLRKWIYIVFGGGIIIFMTTYFLYYYIFTKDTEKNKADQPYIKKTTTDSADFSGSTINSITQDLDGYLWLGTWDGLFMYDGYQAKLFKPNSHHPYSFQGRKVRCLYVDSEGTLWIGTANEGLHRFDKKLQRFHQYKHEIGNPYSLSDNDVMGIWEDAAQNLWVATTQGEINQVQKNEKFADSLSFEVYPYEHRQTDFWSVQNKGNIVWIGSNKGLIRFDTKKPGIPFESGNFQYFNLAEGSSDSSNYNIINTIYIDKSKNDQQEEVVWVGSLEGLKKITYHAVSSSISSVTVYKDPKENAKKNRVRILYKPRNRYQKYLWMGTDEGILQVDENSLKVEDFSLAPGEYQEDKVISFFEDHSGVLWIGTSQGIRKINQYEKPFCHISDEAATELHLSYDDVKSLATDSQGNVWAATSGGGLNKISLDSVTRRPSVIQGYKIAKFNGITASDFVNTLSIDSKNNIWAGTDGEGVFKLQLNDTRSSIETVQQYKKGNGHGISHSYIYSSLSDSKGNVWIGTFSGGLNRYNPGNDQFIRYDTLRGLQEHLSTFPIVKIFEDSRKNIWLGSRGGGVYHFHPFAMQNKHASGTLPGQEKFTTYKSKKGDKTSLLDNYITDIFEDRQGYIWIGTETGLCRFNPETQTFFSITREQGFLAEVVQSIRQDVAGNLWISTKEGLVRFDAKDLYKDEGLQRAFQKFDDKDGLQGNFFNNNTSLKIKEILLFGGIDGITLFEPKKIQRNPFLPKIVFTNFQLNHQNVTIGNYQGEKTWLTQSINETEKITLNYHDKILSFEFAALHYAHPEKNQYAYKMEGFDKNWIFTNASTRYAHYTNLSPGTYTFKVKASNNDALWTTEGASLKIRVLPPFWMTYWAFAVYISLLLLIIYAIRNTTLMRANYRHKIHMERVEREKSKEIHEMEMRFFTNISHEIRTPLTLILGPLEKLLRYEGLNARIYNQLSVMQHHGHRLYRLLNQLMDFRKHNTGGMKLRAAKGDFIKFMKEIHISFREHAQDKEIHYLFESALDEFELYYDRDVLEKVFFNILSNAFKFTPREGQIRIQVQKASSKEVQEEKLHLGVYANFDKIYPQEYFKIRINDTGKGIGASELVHIFKRFYQAESNIAQNRAGTGIGLALARELVLLHKGGITVQSKEEVGTEFVIYLPTGKKHLEETEVIPDFKDSEYAGHYSVVKLKPKEILPPRSPQNQKEKPLLLIVEDNKDVRFFIKSILEETYHLEEAENAKEGMKKALEFVPDLVISDVMMPGIDGIEFCRKLKKDEKTSHIPVILLTARTSLIFKVEGLETGADDYITKPFEPSYLLARVINLINQRKFLRKRFSDKIIVKPIDIVATSADEEFLERARKVVDKNISNSSYTVESFAKDMGMSKMQIYRKLKGLLNQSGNEFIRLQRLQRAAELLKQNRYTIAEITYEVGFNDLKYFRSRFEKHYGMLPSEYVAQHTKESNSGAAEK